MYISMKKFYLRTFGCQMNVYDSAKIAVILTRKLGYQETEDPATADLIIFNTCHIREKAHEKLYSDLGRLLPYRQAKIAKGEYLTIIVAGCIAQADGEEIFQRNRHIDAILGPESYHKLPEILYQLEQQHQNQHRAELDFTPQEKFQLFDEIPTATSSFSSYITIQEGCDKFCSYCVVPYTRGKEYSRPVVDILTEAQQLIAQGVKEITLIGQNVSAFNQVHQGKLYHLADLLVAVAQLPGVERLRYTTSYPTEITPELIQLHGDLAVLAPYIHLPVQSGSNKILASMNRRHRREEYLEIIRQLRQARPDIAISTDIIVGFPGETEEDFQDTMDLVEQVKFAQHFSFKYSRRYGTPAASMAEQIPDKVKTERLIRLQTLLNSQQLSFNQQTVGKTVHVLVEDMAQRHQESAFGHTEYMQTAIISQGTSRLIGHIVPIVVTHGGANEIQGNISQ